MNSEGNFCRGWRVLLYVSGHFGRGFKHAMVLCAVVFLFDTCLIEIDTLRVRNGLLIYRQRLSGRVNLTDRFIDKGRSELRYFAVRNFVVLFLESLLISN